MEMSRLRSRAGLVLVGLFGMMLLVAACGDDDNDNDLFDDVFNDDTPTPTATAPVDDDDDDNGLAPADTPEPADPEPTQEARADIEEVDGSGVSGEVHVRSFNSTSEVTVELEGLDADEQYTMQIRSGSCGDDAAPLAFPLAELEVDQDGAASVTEELEVGFGLLVGNHLTIEIAPEEEGATEGEIVGCADIDDDDDNGLGNGLDDDGDGDDDDDELNG